MRDETIIREMQATPGAVVYRQQDETVDVQALKARVAEYERELAEAKTELHRTNDICLEVMRERDEAQKIANSTAELGRELLRQLQEEQAKVAALHDAVNYALGTANCHWDNDALDRLSAAMLYTNDAARRHDAEVSARTLEEAADMKGQLEMIERGETMSDYLSRLAAEKRKEEPK
jgi:hypothetical protein